MLRALLIFCAIIIVVSAVFATPVERTTANNGNLVMEGVPPIPGELAASLTRFENVRSASFRGWADNGGIYIGTRFADTTQLHRVDRPGGARHQLTFDREPIGDVQTQPGGGNLLYLRDAGGSEFAQIFAFDPATGDARMLSDGESRNGAVTWDRDGRRFAFQSTRRNGASNDIWLMDAGEPESARMVLESPDGTWWGPVEFSASGSRLLALNYVSIADSRAWLVDLDSGESLRLTGGGDEASANIPIGFDDAGDGYWLISNDGSEFANLAWQPLAAGAPLEVVTGDIQWDISDAAVAHGRDRIAFTVNESGRSALYLLDTENREYRRVDTLPTGVIYNMAFSPDDSKLALTLSTAATPSDVYTLELGNEPLAYGELVRWTMSEVGGLDTTQFVLPELIEYPTFDEVNGERRHIPAWLYKPAGDGPFPVVISIHGGPESQSRPSFSSSIQMWIDRLGVAVVVPNVRGSAGYGKTYLSLDNGFKREDSVRDIGALLDWVAERPDLDQERVAVIGGSYGGYMVLASAVHYSDRLRAAVDIVGISSFVTFLENTEDYRRDLRRVEYGDERDPDMRAHLERISPLNNVDKIDVPMFVVQGQNDPRVPVTEAEQIVKALRRQGVPVWYMNALNEGHGFRKKENRDIYRQAVVLFFEQHLLK